MFKGTIFLHNNGKQLEVFTVNHGPSPGTLTHNIRPTEDEALNRAGRPQHDDNGRFGHGDPVAAGTDPKPSVSVRQFPIGGSYRTGDADQAGHWNWRWKEVRIDPGAWFRVGFRQRAFAVAQIPKAGEVVEIRYEDMAPQTKSAMGGQYASHGWAATPIERTGAHLPPQLQAIMKAREPYVIRGQARIEPVPHPKDPTKLTGWNVWFENTAREPVSQGQTRGFTATVTLTNANGEGAKNAGLGLESMACPTGGYACRQFIAYDGDYGVEKFGIRAREAVPVRLGIRGHSHTTATLPSLEQGTITVDLAKFTKAPADHQSDWFDETALVRKIGEKKAFIDIFREGVRINDELPDTIYTGEEAFIRAEFKQPPRVLIDRVPDGPDTPGGGWKVRMKNELPDSDHLGRVGFSAAIKVAHADKLLADPAAIPDMQFSPERREFSWYIPEGHSIAGVALEAGTELVIDTGPLGWRGRIQLPVAGETIDSSKDEATLHALWSLRESDYHRAKLYPNPEGSVP